MADPFSTAFQTMDPVALHLQLIIEACTAEVVPPLTASVDDVETNWHPTGFYTPAQLEEIINFAIQVTRGASDALASAMGHLQLGIHQDMLGNAGEALAAVQQKSEPFTTAVIRAKNEGFKVIESTGLKRWIVLMLKAANETHRVVAIVDCARPGLLGVLERLVDEVRRFVNFIVAIGGLALEVVKAAGNLVLKIPDFVGSLVRFAKFLPWVALAFGGYYVAVKTNLISNSRHDPLKLRERNTFKPWKRAGEP
jgi:hypothetical protein